ncbi:hypothetical protein DPMN_079621 [Dreissena polymorpha]|uniref:Uncharacterized protein n=1 Tax=Dreissena polymorpha TaxID=45954 RepID=A0A9D3YPD0_DREPO|nr:hypothetical protein DPMN_079621 [Dreissena polymorpha]
MFSANHKLFFKLSRDIIKINILTKDQYRIPLMPYVSIDEILDLVNDITGTHVPTKFHEKTALPTGGLIFELVKDIIRTHHDNMKIRQNMWPIRCKQCKRRMKHDRQKAIAKVQHERIVPI